MLAMNNTLTPAKLSHVRAMARAHFDVGFVNEDLFSGSRQVSRVYRAEFNRLMTEWEKQHAATTGGSLSVNPVQPENLS